jgi:hypothetical protein
MTEGERPDVPHSRAWETKPRFTLCRETAALAVNGRCPVHDSDGCLFEYVQVSALRPECAALEREKAVLEGVGRELLGLLWDEDLHWLLHPTDDQIERAEAVAHKLRAALSDSSQGQG